MRINRGSISIALVFCILGLALGQTSEKCCSTYDATGSICMTCPKDASYQGNNCIIEIKNCQQYQDCFSCAACE